MDLRRGAAETARVPPVARLLFPSPRCSRRRPLLPRWAPRWARGCRAGWPRGSGPAGTAGRRGAGSSGARAARSRARCLRASTRSPPRLWRFDGQHASAERGIPDAEGALQAKRSVELIPGDTQNETQAASYLNQARSCSVSLRSTALDSPLRGEDAA